MLAALVLAVSAQRDDDGDGNDGPASALAQFLFDGGTCVQSEHVEVGLYVRQTPGTVVQGEETTELSRQRQWPSEGTSLLEVSLANASQAGCRVRV